MTDVTKEEAAMLEALWSAYSDLSSEIRNLFDDWKLRSLTGDHLVVHDEIKSFAKMDSSAFYILMLSLQGTEEFYSDVESVLGSEAKEELKSLDGQYGETLAETFRVVYRDQFRNYKNTVTDTEFSLHNPVSGITPTIEFLIYSGNITVAEMQADPQHYIDLAHSLTEAVDDSMEQIVDEDIPITDVDVSEMKEFHAALSEAVSDLDEKIEALET